MRRSTMYLGFALFFMAFAGVAAVKSKRHRYQCNQNKIECTQPDSRAVASPYSTDTSELLQHGYVAAMVRDYPQCAEYARKAIEQDPRSVEAHGMLGYALRGLNDFRAAEASYTIAILLAEKDPIGHRRDLVDVLTGRAAAYLAQNRPQAARLDLDRVLPMALQQASQAKSPGADLYQLACIYSVRSELAQRDQSVSQQGRTQAHKSDQAEAIDYLKRAMRKDYPSQMHRRGDLDLDPIRTHKSFPR